MQHVATDDVLRRALRAQVCVVCSYRPEESESLGPIVARACEGQCSIFANLDALKTIAVRLQGQALPDFERAILDGICQSCTATPTAGDYCYERFSRSCPLSVNAGLAISIIESILSPGAKAVAHTPAKIETGVG